MSLRRFVNLAQLFLPGRLQMLTCSPRRSFSTVVSVKVNGESSNSEKVKASVPKRKVKSFYETPLGKNGQHLLDGLDLYTVEASEDRHPLAVYGIDSESPSSDCAPILLLHGRTWSSVPVYHLLGGPKLRHEGTESRSLMEALLEQGLQPYCMDFRGFGGTPHDETGYVEPLRCVSDAQTVLSWIQERHQSQPPALLGWSQGAMVAQLMAQKNPHLMSQLVLYGSIYDPQVRYPREPLYRIRNVNQTIIENHFDDAIEDFTLEGTIPPEPAKMFAEAALISDPVKAVWKHLYQFNNCDPARLQVPTLVIVGDQDPYSPIHVQQHLFNNLGRACDRTFSILADSDHAVHLLDGRARLVNKIVSFAKNGKKSDRQFE